MSDRERDIETVYGKDGMPFFVKRQKLVRVYRTVFIEGTVRIVSGRVPHGKGYRSPFDHHGHLIADVFGGPRGVRSGNIVAMHAYQNNGAAGEYSQMEKDIHAHLERHGTAFMRVECAYESDTDRRPHQFDIVVKTGQNGGIVLARRIYNFYPFMKP